MNRPRPIERRTSTIGLFSFGHGYRNGAEEQTGEMRTAGGQSGGRGDEEERDHDEEGSAEGATQTLTALCAQLDDGDSDFEDLEPDLDLEPVAQRRFARSPAPSPASSRFLRSSRTSRRLGLSLLKFGGSTSADAAAKGRSSPVWYAQARVRVEPSFALAPAADDDHCSSLVDPHTLTSHRPGPTLSPSSSRPSSAASSTLSSSSDASSAQDLATAQIVVHAQSRSSFEQQEHEQQQVELGAYAYRRSSVGTIVPRLRALEPMSPFKPRFEAVDEPGPSSASHETGGAHDKDAGDPSLALAHLGSPAFRLDSDDPTALAALRRAGEHVFGPASSAASAAARPAPQWAAQQGARALGPPPPFGATSEGGLEGGEGPQSPGSPDSASRLRAGAGSMGEGGTGSERGKTGAERGSGARRVLGERQI
ncbi:uncharacterized protein RHOBADRAFT_50372 [Rhodotorula graminis WP1]|uniref:Uncharacterized protein n=1 Tax=Rhodotorula graminis (strain WP1) TaxID=578459 RepID=A0A0P9GGE7_RHOGW|nr:uncharacterized protein RHOBADRAFT_50372 [Rhodotorula graminis WP1]KPV71931.1 hypothetical protein RHOBADRAFT_50372 [Rhodotorula graminis WP1]